MAGITVDSVGSKDEREILESRFEDDPTWCDASRRH